MYSMKLPPPLSLGVFFVSLEVFFGGGDLMTLTSCTTVMFFVM